MEFKYKSKQMSQIIGLGLHIINFELAQKSPINLDNSNNQNN